MSTKAEELANALENLEATGWGGDCFALTDYSEKQAELAAAELRRLAAVESELADCKAAYESQFRELHALKASIGEPVAWIRGSGLSMLKLENGGCATVFAS